MVLLRGNAGVRRSYGAVARAGLIALGLIAAFSVTAQIPKGPQAAPENHRHPDDRQGNTKDPPLSTGQKPNALTKGAAPKGNSDQPPPSDLIKPTDWIMAISAFFTLVFTVGLTASTWRLWLETKRLAQGAEDQHGTLKKSVRAARLGNVAAWRGATAARKAAEGLTVVERAYLYPIVVNAGAMRECIGAAWTHSLEGSDDYDTAVAETAELVFRIRNHGKTPGIVKFITASVGAIPTNFATECYVSEPILGPNQETGDIIVEMRIGLTPHEASDIMRYKNSLIFSGQITFDDIWGIENVTQFDFRWDTTNERMTLHDVSTKPIEKH